MVLFTLDIEPQVESVNHMEIPLIIFRGTSIVFSIAVYITTNSVKGFLFLHILAKICDYLSI